MTTASLIQEKKARLEMLEKLFHTLEREEEYISMKTVWYDTDEPRLDDNGEPRTREDGTIIYKQSYREEAKSEDEYSEEDKAQLMAIQTIKNQLEKMI